MTPNTPTRTAPGAPSLTLCGRRFYIVRAGQHYAQVIAAEYAIGRRMLTARWITGPWRLLITGTRAQRDARRTRYLNRITGQARPRRAVR